MSGQEQSVVSMVRDTVLHEETIFQRLMFTNVPLLFFNCELVPNNHFIRSHWHDALEILFLREGGVMIKSGMKTTKCADGDIAFININTIHAIHPLTNPSKYDCLLIRRSFLESLRLENIIFPSKLTDQAVYRQYLKMKQDAKKAGYDHDLLFQRDLLELLSLTLPFSELAEDKSPLYIEHEKIVNNILAYIESHLSEPISMNDICQHVNFCKSHVCRIFRDFTGYTVTEMINRLRCAAARDLLLTKEITVAQCAEQCGFTNLSYFTKTYKSIIGELPSETYKKK